MRKQSKIISLILVLALLLSMLVLPGVTAAADTSATGTESGIEAQSETFTPTATWTENYSNVKVVTSSVANNIVSGVGFGNWQKDDKGNNIQTLYHHDVDAGSYEYGIFTSFAEKTLGNHFVNVNFTSTSLTTATTTTADDGTTTTTYTPTGYYVIDIDLATDSDVIANFTLSPIIRGPGYCDSSSDFLGNILPADGYWHHVTLVGDMAGNKLYTFVDGVQVGSTRDAYKAANAGDGSVGMNITSLRINIGSGVAMNVGESIAYDNISARVFSTNDAIASALAAGTLGGYDNVISAPAEEKLPAIATVDGTEYYNVNAISERLAYIFADSVELLRDYAGTVNIGVDVTVETNGLSFVQGTDFTVADGATVTTSGTVVTVTGSPVVGSVAQNEVVTNTTTFMNNSKSDDAENIVTSVAYTNFSDATAQIYLVQATGSDGTYIDVRTGASHDAASTAHAHFNYCNYTKLTYATGSYLVMDYDLFADSAFINAWVGVTSRNSDGKNVGGSSYFVSNIGLTPGRWNHVTAIYSVDTNSARFYVDGVYTYTLSSNAISSTTVTDTYFEGVRFNIRNQYTDTLTADQNLAIDNMSIRINLTDDEIKSCWSSDYIASWRGMTEGATLPALATVDGVKYDSTAALNEVLALASVEPREVVFYRDPLGTVTVECDATINTNGYAVSLAYVEGATVSENGNIITVDAPLKAASTATNAGIEVSGYGSIIHDAIAADGLDNSITWKFVSAAGFYTDGTTVYMNGTKECNAASQSYVVTNNYAGNTYWLYTHGNIASGTTANSFADIGPAKVVSYDASISQYFIYDFDLAALTEAKQFNLQSVTRISSGSSSGSNWGNAQTASDVANLGEIGCFQHVTIVLDVNNNDSHLFVNGQLVKSITSGGFVGEAVHTDFVNGNVTALNHNGIRFGSNSHMDVAVANFSLRYISGATNYSEQIAGGDLGDFNVYTSDYVLPEVAPIAYVDGEYVPTAAALSEVLAAKEYGTEAQVTLTDSFTDAATVSGSALVNTNGYTHGLVAQDGVVFTDLGNNLLSYYETSLVLELQNNATNVLSAIKNSSADNLFGGVAWLLYTTSDTSKYKGYLATDNVTGNQYAYFGNEDYDGTTNSYMELQGVTKVNYDANTLQYMVYDFDIAIETDAEVTFESVARNADTTNSPDHNGGPTVNAILSGYTNGDFQHITQVVDINNNLAYTFVNGKLHGSYKAYKDLAYDLFTAGTDYMQFDGIRLGSKTLNQYSVDNVYIRKVDVATTDTATDSITAALAASDITKWSGAITSIGNHVAPVGEVDGNYYYTTADLGAALADSSTEHDSEIMREISDAIKVGSLGTLTNKVGADVSAAYGYRLTNNGDGTYTFTVETREGTVTININGSTAYELKVLFGTDLSEYLADKGIIEGAILFDADGNIYTDWAADFATVEGDATYDLTATLCERMFVVLVNGAVKDYEDSETGFFTAIKTNETSVIILNKDMTITIGKESNSFNGNHTVRLNGHTITTDVIDSYTVEKTNDDGTTTTTEYTPKNNGNHMFSIGGVNGNFEFVGPGTLYDCSRENTTQFIFANYTYTGTVTFKDMKIVGSGSLATMRGGNLTFDNVDIDLIMAQGTVFVQFGEEYNGSYSKNDGTLTFIDCNVNARHHRAYWGKFINIKNIPSSPNIVYTVNITDSVMNMGYGSEYAIVSNNANTVINITGSEIRSNNLFDHGYKNASNVDVVFLGTVNVGEGTKFANAVNASYDFVKIGEGLQLVNSGDLNAPYLYTSEYATVTWPDASTEYWADGTYPTNPNYKLANVEKVVAGESYSFSEIESLGFAIKANLTLTSGIQFNLYVPTSAAITAVNIDGIDYSIEGANIVAVNGEEHYVFAYDILPSEAAGVFTFAISTADWTIAREMSVLDYANLVYASAPAANTLMSNILKYVYESHAYFAVYSENLDAISSAFSTNPNSVVAPSAKTSNTADIQSVIESASLNIESTLKFRFNIAAGADISDLTFTVDGKAVEYTIGDGYVEIELRAYDLLKDITISVGGSTGTYNLYAYYDHITTTAAGCNGTSERGNDNEAARAYKAQELIKALCSYAAAAAAYHG